MNDPAYYIIKCSGFLTMGKVHVFGKLASFINKQIINFEINQQKLEQIVEKLGEKNFRNFFQFFFHNFFHYFFRKMRPQYFPKVIGKDYLLFKNLIGKLVFKMFYMGNFGNFVSKFENH